MPQQKLVDKHTDYGFINIKDPDCSIPLSLYGSEQFQLGFSSGSIHNTNKSSLKKLIIKKVISEIDYHLPQNVKQLSCLFVVNKSNLYTKQYFSLDIELRLTPKGFF